jgi:hypothetical protein
MNLGAVILEIDRLLEDFPELQDDDALKLDMIEGETDALEIAARLTRLHVRAKHMVDAVKAEKAALATRQERYAHQAERASQSLQTLLNAIGERKLELGPGTVSLRKSPDSVVVRDVDELPQGYFKVTRQADKAAIKAAIKGGDTIPGAELVTGGETIAVRVL